MKVHTRKDLELLGCSSSDCKHDAHEGLYLHSSCHTSVPTWTRYLDGILYITCAECSRMVAKIRVGND